MATGETTTYEADALVFAVGTTGMQKIIQANPALGRRPEFRRIMNLRGIDVVSTRLWLDKRVSTQFPANVLAGFEDNMGSTYFNLNDLQVCRQAFALVLLWHACPAVPCVGLACIVCCIACWSSKLTPPCSCSCVCIHHVDVSFRHRPDDCRAVQDEYADADQTVIASDFYHSNTLMHLSNEEIIQKVKANLDYCEPQFQSAQVTDSAVLKFPKAVSHFSTGSYQNRPKQVRYLLNFATYPACMLALMCNCHLPDCLFLQLSQWHNLSRV